MLCVALHWRITRSLSRRLRGLRLGHPEPGRGTGCPIEWPGAGAGRGGGRGVWRPRRWTTGGTNSGRSRSVQHGAAHRRAHRRRTLADTRRGFQKVILGIARQSQNLVNMQLGKLDALERQHTDPEILKGLYELDSTASQLRRYEENLVIISGEQPPAHPGG
ncbi:hypothetical protein LV779_10590 [Streptomyces thinghirensis]|nr:hypothetical protein [Streptomyces thinghirensis]